MVVSRATGAVLRAGLMALLVAMPQLMLGGAPGSTPIVALFALMAAAFTASEYASPAPSLIEFRDAPPYNRLRVLALLGTLGALGLVLGDDRTTLTLIVRALGASLGEVMDFPYSPVRLMLLMLPQGGTPGADPALADALRMAAAIAYSASVAMVLAFVASIRLGAWPRGPSFNVWVNLPQFDPTAGGDVVDRLQTYAQVNLILGLTLPFLLPMTVDLAFGSFDRVLFGEPATMTWAVTVWAFLPATILMRGVALERLARMIALQRAHAAGEAEAEAEAGLRVA